MEGGCVNKDLMFSSASTEWGTPQELFDRLNAIFHFDLDAAATAENAKCEKFYTKENNALYQKWGGNVWLNPPYGRHIGAFVKKAYEEVMQGEASSVVLLLPARTDTTWYHEYCAKGIVIFLRGRLRFGGAQNSAPFPSMIVIFMKVTS